MIENEENTTSIAQAVKKTYTVEEIASTLNISMVSAYSLVQKKAFHSIRVDNLIRNSKPSFDEWLNPQLFKER